MCGLACLFGNFGPERTRQSVERMLQLQTHRGPDSSGLWTDTVKGVDVAVGLRRLKILDLSDAANQPMFSEDGRFVLVFNGEIYNYVELRLQLSAAGIRFRTRGDTEVLLQALILWGPDALSRLNGMWAFTLLDRVAGEVFLSRDRFGIKPLYTYADERGLFVSSEIKAILEVCSRKFRVTPSVANAYLYQALLHADRATFFAGIEEFPAGHFAKTPIEDIAKKPVQTQRYWTIPTTVSDSLTENAMIESVRATFLDSVKIRLRSDVPVGVLLSGGTDSSAIAAAVHYLEPFRGDIKLISAVGADGDCDEHPFINAVGNHLDCPIERVVLDYPPAKALALLSEVSWFNDEPIIGFPAVAHYLLMRQASDLGVTVLLSGQGADEILCGYKKYLGFYLQELISSGRWLSAGRVLQGFLREGTVLPQFSYHEAKRYLPSWLRFPALDVRGPSLRDDNQQVRFGLNGGGVVERQAVDIEKLSVPALVHYEDRMSMAVGREIRLPFLDYRLVSLLVPLPVEFKLRAGWTKWILRRAMEPMLPKEIVWRRDKQHFIIPQHQWFHRKLREEMRKLIESEWVSERLGVIDRRKFGMLYEAYLRQPLSSGRIGAKDILAPVTVELWARRFERFLSP